MRSPKPGGPTILPKLDSPRPAKSPIGSISPYGLFSHPLEQVVHAKVAVGERIVELEVGMRKLAN
jgi:hypothetical protein